MRSKIYCKPGEIVFALQSIKKQTKIDMKLQHILFTSLFSFYCSAAGAQSVLQYDLSGTWRFQLDPMGFGKTPGSELYQAKLAETITLPGSTDTGGKGI